MNDDQALSVSTVASCIAMLADSIATVPLRALTQGPDGTKTAVKTPQLIKNPWPEGTLIDWLTQVMVSMLLRGNFFGRIVSRDSQGFATSIQPIHPDRVNAKRGPDGKRVYRVQIPGPVGGSFQKVIPTEDMVHIPYLLTPGSFIGLNPVEYQRMNWGLAAATEQYGGQFFANSAQPSGVIELEGDLSEEETLELARAWRSAHGGISQAGLPAILTGGAKWSNVSIAPDDAQFLQTRQFQREQIISWFRIPPHKIGITDRTPGPTTSEDVEMAFVTDALIPPATRIEAYLSDLLRPKQFAQFDFSARMRANLLMRMQAAQIKVNTGIASVDEIRASEDMPPLPNKVGNVTLRAANMTPVDLDTGQAVEGFEPSAQKPVNSGGFGDGGGDPGNSPNPNAPRPDNPLTSPR